MQATRQFTVLDYFCGLGGASAGIEKALGVPVRVAVNHNKEAIRMHSENHPTTTHLTEDVFGDTRVKKQTHFALCVDDFDGFVAELRAKGVNFWSWSEKTGEVTGRPDGFRQIYLADPDGYWIEVNDHNRHVA